MWKISNGKNGELKISIRKSYKTIQISSTYTRRHACLLTIFASIWDLNGFRI